MNIQLKKLQINLAFSKETTMFKADVYINGYKAGCASNEGHGGCTDYHWYDAKGKELILEAEAYCKTLPQIEYGDMKWDMDFEQYIENLVNEVVGEKEKAKFIKKRDKACLNQIIYCLPEDGDIRYKGFGWKNHTIASLLKHPQGAKVLSEKIEELKKQGYIILNKNIPTPCKH